MTGGSTREEQAFSTNDTLVADDEFHFSGMSISRQPTSSEKLLFWRDGVIKQRNTDFDGAAAINMDGSTPVYIGAVQYGSFGWHGFLDEVRISNIARGSNWIAACYKNQSDPSSFHGIGAEENPPPGLVFQIK